MVRWITRDLGVMTASESLAKLEPNTVIYDIRHLTDGRNTDEKKLTDTIISAYKLLCLRSFKVVLMSERGVSRPCLVAATLLVQSTSMSWEDAVAYVKMKVPNTNINSELLNQVKYIIP